MTDQSDMARDIEILTPDEPEVVEPEGDELDTPAGGDNPDELLEELDEPEGEGETDETEQEEELEEKEELDDNDEKDAEGEPKGGRPPARQILAKYPSLFKDFPGLKDAYYKEKQYTELFVTPVAAKEAKDRAEVFAKFEVGLGEGKIEMLLDSMKTGDPDGFKKVTKNFLPQLAKTDPDAYEATILPVLGNFLRWARDNAARSGNKALGNSVKHLAKLVYNQYDVPDDKPESTKVDPEREKLDKEKTEFYSAKRVEFRDKIVNRTQAVILKNLTTHLDPKGVLSPFALKAAIAECRTELGKQLHENKVHMGTMNHLFEAAEKARFAGDWETKLISAYLGSAKQILPSIRKKVLAEALKDSKGKAGDRQKKVLRPDPNKIPAQPAASGKLVRYDRTKIKPEQIDRQRTTDKMIMEGRVYLK